MGANIVMPQLGETVAEGKIVSWFKKIGDSVSAGDRLFEVETDKVTIDVEAIDTGTITEISIGDGITAPVGAVVAVLGDASAATAVAQPATGIPGGSQSTGVTRAAPALSAFEEVHTARGLFGKALQDGLRITPLARRLIVEQGLDLKELVADGKTKGFSRVAEKDVRAYAAGRPQVRREAQPPAPQATPAPVPSVSLGIGLRDEVIAFSAIRQKTADRLAENWRTIPHVFQALEVDFTTIDAAPKRTPAPLPVRTTSGTETWPLVM